MGLSFIYHAKGPRPLIVASQEVLVSSLGHPHLRCFPFFHGACGSSASRLLTLFVAVLMLLCCHTSPRIDAHCVPSCDPGQCPPHDVIIDVEVNQRAPDFIWQVLHCIKAMRMWLTIAADNNAESNGVVDQSPSTSRKLLLSSS
jgi:hypothetical protein